MIAAERLTALQQEDLALRLQHLEPVGDQPLASPPPTRISGASVPEDRLAGADGANDDMAKERA